ncbi:hypothetical protein LOK49_LG10G01137 [Camellia lanceoleosa]|uniref:Uncharacterized protein n=1 Tax=Camellia lanceoleosa TaxID=1840588 RepID=A0ACC0G7B7_9ERIC|nr:hypothetical protein LOK49_LG10G01137 [Camellia lanceoleosa]
MLAKIDQNEHRSKRTSSFSLSSSLRTLAFHSLCASIKARIFKLSMASGSSGRNNSASKGFDFTTTDDIVCSYEELRQRG